MSSHSLLKASSPSAIAAADSAICNAICVLLDVDVDVDDEEEEEEEDGAVIKGRSSKDWRTAVNRQHHSFFSLSSLQAAICPGAAPIILCSRSGRRCRD